MEQKNISFGYGIHRSPTLGKDGELSECVNLIPKNGELVNIKPPVSFGTLTTGMEKLMAIHNVAGETHYIIQSRVTFTTGGPLVHKYSLYYITEDSTDKHTIAICDDKSNSIVVNGNMLISATENGVNHYLWRTDIGEYYALQELPELGIQFALKGDLLIDSSYRRVDIKKGGSGIEYESTPFRNDTFTANNGNKERNSTGLNAGYYKVKVVGSGTLFIHYYDTNGFLLTETHTEENYVYLPKDCSYIVYEGAMTVSGGQAAHYNNGNFTIYFYKSATSDEFSLDNTTENINVALAAANEMLMKEQNNGKFVLPFFVRASIKLYDGTYIHQTAPCLMMPNHGITPLAFFERQNAEEYTTSMSLAAVSCDLMYKIPQSVITALEDWKDIATSVSFAVSEPIYEYNQGAAFNEDKPIMRVDPMNEDTMEQLYSVSSIAGQQYAKRGILSLLNQNNHISSSKSYMKAVLPKFDDGTIAENYTNKGNFYVIADYDIDALTGDEFTRVETNSVNLANLVTMRRMEDDYISHDKLSPSVMFVYNNRLNMANVKREYFAGFDVCSMVGYTNGQNQYVARVTINDNGNVQYVNSSSTMWTGLDGLPMWFYYPNPNATEAVIHKFYRQVDYETGESSTPIVKSYKIILKKHQYLNGAYWLGSGKESVTMTEIEGFEANVTSHSTIGNAIYTSRANNPFAFDALGDNRVGTGEILAVSAATKATSSGTEHGKEPLIVFSSDGVWPLSVGDDGTYIAKKALSRDVCINPNAVLQTDDAVLFVTAKGLMITNGSESTGCKLLSGEMNGKNVSESIISGQSSLHEDLIVEDTEPFTSMLSECSMMYDYYNSMVHIYPTYNAGKHYVMDLESGEFSSVVDEYSDIESVVPGYPYSVAQTNSGELIRFEAVNDYDTVRSGIALTRPIAFGSPYAMKIIHDARISYSKSSELTKCRQSVFVSNDRHRWYKLSSLGKHSFKWYRFAIFTRLTDNDALEGLTCMTETRRTNKLR